ncbi:hypothetical protein [Heliorestis convoluta]|uniref:Uncharacterized protein n=1 Tax=Heliorestis convoluta TaxID=356322 RepID=A0A5Q2N2I4_9FIRM|nr:hypothetical protein [Heliorestis convoluta]QGG48079.1 hypothetical protein FTV88_1981 [Heliorestis convoluta]
MISRKKICFRNLTPVNGFDMTNLNNARQNNYAWSMSELGDYIYVGTGRNILVNIINSITPGAQLPALIDPGPIDNRAEIWRYKKDGSLPWQRVYKAPEGSGIIGFRFMIRHRPFRGGSSLYAATIGPSVQVLKSTNGVNWFILPDNVLQGTSSRAMVIQKGKIYMSTIEEGGQNPPLLYRSEDPEFIPWESVIDTTVPGFDPTRNPTNPISNMEVFNNRIYVGVISPEGVEVWRTNGPEPRLNDWTLIADRGFGDPDNRYTLAMGVFKNHLYVSATKELPLAWAFPRGFDLIRINKNDKWKLVVGGNPLFPVTAPSETQKSASGLGSGFNNPFNVYAWQIQEYDGKLFISTFDDSSNMEVILTTLLANRLALEQLIGPVVTNILIQIYKNVVAILRAARYPIGFDLYVSGDGIHFSPVFLDGLNNPNNYGGRILYVDRRNDLYIGTANPFQGCEVWRTDDTEDYNAESCDCDTQFCNDDHYKCLWKVRKIITDNYAIISQHMPVIMKFLPKEHCPRFF